MAGRVTRRRAAASSAPQKDAGHPRPLVITALWQREVSVRIVCGINLDQNRFGGVAGHPKWETSGEAGESHMAKRVTRVFLITGLILVVVIYTTYCGTRISGGNSIAESNAITSDPYISAFDRLFPDSEHFTSYYTGVYGQPRWNSETLLHGRYEFRMSFDIDIDRLGTKVTPIEPPVFSINPRRHVQLREGGSKSISYEPDGGLDFGPAEWELLVAADGDLTAIGMQAITDSPIIETTDPAPRITRPAIPIP